MDVQQKQEAVESLNISSSSSSLNAFLGDSCTPSNLNNGNHDDDDFDYIEDVSKYPVGYRFRPNDVELVSYYLRRKVADLKLPIHMTHNDIQLYSYDPRFLTAKFEPQGDDGSWYFFTPRERKYPNGKRPNRAAKTYGYWKATGNDKPVVDDKVIIGFKKSLVFYQGKAASGVKTHWIMHEYRLDLPPKKKQSANDMRLDDWVLCKLYKKHNKNSLANEKRKESGRVEKKGDDEVTMKQQSDMDQTSISTINHSNSINQNHSLTHMGHSYQPEDYGYGSGNLQGDHSAYSIFTSLPLSNIDPWNVASPKMDPWDVDVDINSFMSHFDYPN